MPLSLACSFLLSLSLSLAPHSLTLFLSPLSPSLSPSLAHTLKHMCSENLECLAKSGRRRFFLLYPPLRQSTIPWRRDIWYNRTQHNDTLPTEHNCHTQHERQSVACTIKVLQLLFTIAMTVPL